MSDSDCTKTCGFRISELPEKKCGRLRTMGPMFRASDRWYVVCECECGAITATQERHIRNGASQSCGCLIRDVAIRESTTHGMTGTAENSIWSGMIKRCMNKNSASYQNYGGRGLKVCQEWMSFENFFRDMGRRPTADHTLERIDNSKGYQKDNCRWATVKEQANNRRSNIRLEFYGKCRTVMEWSVISQIPASVIYLRLRRGWSPKLAVWSPTRARPVR